MLADGLDGRGSNAVAWTKPNLMSQTTPVAAALAVGLLLASFAGCRSRQSNFQACGECVSGGGAGDFYRQAAADIDFPAVKQCSLEGCNTGLDSLPPRTLRSLEKAQYRDLQIDEVIQQGLANSRVLRDLGGSVLRSPTSTRTVWDPAIQETDPGAGVEAALSAFDAQFDSSLFFENNDRLLNNEFFGGGIRQLQQNAGVHQMQLSKRAVTGTELSARQIVEFDGNNAPGNAFPNAWTVKLETEVRHPLLQGGGMQFNRIAGPTQTPGVYNGVLIARLDADVQLTEFEASVRDLVSNLENAYWDLYFAYRDLDAKIAARDTALDTWRGIQAKFEVGRTGGEAAKEAQAREQYLRFQEEVQNALTGRLIDGTRTGNGSLGGTFRASGGVYVAERRLRRLMNLPASDGELLRPSSEPVLAEVAFDWDRVKLEAAERRVELRRQKWAIRRRELELIASKNHLLPRLDAVGRYRWRGFGRDLIDANGAPLMGEFAGFADTAYEDLLSGDYQEWQLGVELSVPIGYRRAHSAVRNSELRLARERAILCDQQQEVIHDTASAVAEVDRAYFVSQTTYNRLVATNQQLEAVRAAYEADKAPLDLLLDAQRRLAEAESRRYRSLAEYAVAIKNVHYSKGTLLEFDGVYLAEGAWPGKAYADAADLASRRGRARPLNYASSRAPVLSRGIYEQHRDYGGVVQLEQLEHPTDAEPIPTQANPQDDAQDASPASFDSPAEGELLRLPEVVDEQPASDDAPDKLQHFIIR